MRGVIPSAWYNNVQPYMVTMLPGRVGANPAWETTPRSLAPAYFLRQDEAISWWGARLRPWRTFSFQTFLFMRYNADSFNYDPKTGGFFAPYEAPFAYLGRHGQLVDRPHDRLDAIRPPDGADLDRNRTTQDRIREALRAAGYPVAIVNTETLPSSLIRFGYDKGDQFLFLMRTAIAFAATPP